MLKCQKCPWAENHRSWLCGREVGLWLLMRQVPVSRTDTHTDKLCDRSMLLLIILHLVTVSEVYALWGFSGGREDFNRGFNAAKLLSELSPFQRCCIPTGLTFFFFFCWIFGDRQSICLWIPLTAMQSHSTCSKTSSPPNLSLAFFTQQGSTMRETWRQYKILVAAFVSYYIRPSQKREWQLAMN